MKIVFSLECTNSITNGTGATCYRFAEELAKRGHEIIMLGEELKPEQTSPFTYFGLKHFTFPIFEALIVKDGFNFVYCDPATIYNAVKDADIVHLFSPFKLGSVTRLVSEIADVPISAAFHILPQNITAALHLSWFEPLNNRIFSYWRKYIFRHVRHVHCPSQMTADQLQKHHYQNKYHVISNGITPYFHRVEAEKPPELQDKIIVTMSGRLAYEKRQDLIIKAVARSKYNSRIQIVFCGKGPAKRRYLKIAEKEGLTHRPIIKFCDQEELRNTLSYTDIYVHASDFEIEGISAIEAIACGAVPIISDAKLCATSTFSLDERCIFRHGSPRSLMEHLDYFIEHPEVRAELSKAYEKEGEEYHLEKMVSKMEEMFYEAIEDHKKGLDPIQNKTYRKDKRKKRKILKRLKEAGIDPNQKKEHHL